MKLSHVERQLLRAIRKEYPIPHNAADKSVIGIGERPLPTEGALGTSLSLKNQEVLRAAIARLLSYQCIAKVYLFAPAEFVEQWVAGRTIRHVTLGERAGQECYQITTMGEGVLDRCLREQVKRVFSKWISKVVEEYVLLLIALLVGMLISSLFGFDIRRLRS